MPFNFNADRCCYLSFCLCYCMHHVLNVVFHRFNWIYRGESSLASIIFELIASIYLRNFDPVIEAHPVLIVRMIWHWLWAARP